jgi:hypothetical protein
MVLPVVLVGESVLQMQVFKLEALEIPHLHLHHKEIVVVVDITVLTCREQVVVVLGP